MSQVSLQKLWLTLSIICVAFAFAVHSQLQGGPFEVILKPVFGAIIKEGTPRAIASMWGIYLLGAFTLIAHYVLWTHSRITEPDWKSRYPFRLLDVPVESDLGSKAQYLAFVLLTAAPVVSLGRFWVVLIDKGILCTRAGPKESHVHDLTAGLFSPPADWSIFRGLGDEYRLADADGLGCSAATTWFPIFSPILLGAVTLTSVYWLARAMISLRRKPDGGGAAFV